MKLYSLEDTILKIAEAVPDIRTVHKGDVYYYNEQENVEYSAFNVLMREVFEYRSDYYTIFHVNLFAFDRLTESKDNLSDCESHAIQQLKAIIKKLEDLGATIDSVAYYPFTQRFNDLCAGAYADVRIRVETNDCGDYYFDIGDIIDLYDIYITKNGTYTAETGGAYKTVTVNVEGGGTDLKYYAEDVDESTNAQLNVNNNIIQVSRDGIEIYDKDNKGRINVDYDGVNVYGSALTFNDARVLTTNDLDDVNDKIDEIKGDIPTLPTLVYDGFDLRHKENEMVGVNELPSYIARTVNYGNDEYNLVGAFYYTNEQGTQSEIEFYVDVVNPAVGQTSRVNYIVTYGLDGVRFDKGSFTVTSDKGYGLWTHSYYCPVIGEWILLYIKKGDGLITHVVIEEVVK